MAKRPVSNYKNSNLAPRLNKGNKNRRNVSFIPEFIFYKFAGNCDLLPWGV